jgi:DNA-binding NtrC family response regulator
LPDASGLELLAKSRYRHPEVPVIVITASDAVADVMNALRNGATDYVEHQRLMVSLANALKMLQDHHPRHR